MVLQYVIITYLGNLFSQSEEMAFVCTMSEWRFLWWYILQILLSHNNKWLMKINWFTVHLGISLISFSFVLSFGA